VLRDDGTLWLNLGDSYSGSGKGIGSDHGKAVFTDIEISKTDWRSIYGTKRTVDKTGLDNNHCPNIGIPPGGISGIDTVDMQTKCLALKPKDLIGIPWLVAFALRADGWYLRQDIIWAAIWFMYTSSNLPQ
jgi:hypothetical protein